MPTVVQTKAGTNSQLSGSFTSAVTSGNLLVFGVWAMWGAGTNVVSGVSDSFGSTFSRISGVRASGASSRYTFTEIFYGYAANSGTHSYSVQLPDTANLVNYGINAVEVQNAGNSGVTVASGYNVSSSTPATNSTSFSAGDFLFAQNEGVDSNPSPATWTAGANFTIITDNTNGAEYSLTAASPTTFPMTLGSAIAWVETAGVFPAIPTAAYIGVSSSKKQYKRLGRIRR